MSVEALMLDTGLNPSMTEFEQKCYGMSEQDIRDQYIKSITAELCGIEMVVMSILSDCQEMLAMKNPTIPSPNTDERIRKQLNVAKFILSEMMDAKRSKVDNKSESSYNTPIETETEQEMSQLTEYTLEIYKADKRIKRDQRFGRNRVGMRFVESIDFAPSTKDYIETLAADKRKEGFIVKVFETYVQVRNIRNGQMVPERYDTAWVNSVASESSLY